MGRDFPRFGVSAVSPARRALQFGHLIRAPKPKGLYGSARGFVSV
jgi:hypothetical protein